MAAPSKSYLVQSTLYRRVNCFAYVVKTSHSAGQYASARPWIRRAAGFKTLRGEHER